MHKTISVPVYLGDAKAILVGTFIPGRRSNHWEEPDDPPEFDLEDIRIGGQSMFDFLSGCVKILSITNQTTHACTTQDCIEWIVDRYWSDIVRAGNDA